MQNTNVTVLEVGPATMILQDNNVLVTGPLPFVVVPPGHYCIVENPVRYADVAEKKPVMLISGF